MFLGAYHFDACPSPAVVSAFSTSPDFGAALRAAGLPGPLVERLGEVRTARRRKGLEA